jgi:uncharacterized DUF497 family protein
LFDREVALIAARDVRIARRTDSLLSDTPSCPPKALNVLRFVYTDVLRMGGREEPSEPKENTESHSRWQRWSSRMNAASCVRIELTIQESSDGTRLERLASRPMPRLCCWLFPFYREETDGDEITRIISARKAEKNDIRRYQEQEME